MMWHGSGTLLPDGTADDVRAGICESVTCWFSRSRLSESNRRPIHYE
jgi:hypothetical protein